MLSTFKAKGVRGSRRDTRRKHVLKVRLPSIVKKKKKPRKT